MAEFWGKTTINFFSIRKNPKNFIQKIAKNQKKKSQKILSKKFQKRPKIRKKIFHIFFFQKKKSHKKIPGRTELEIQHLRRGRQMAHDGRQPCAPFRTCQKATGQNAFAAAPIAGPIRCAHPMAVGFFLFFWREKRKT